MRKLTCLIPHSPGFESTFALLDRLQQRGSVQVEALVSKRLIKTDPRVEAALAASKLNYLAFSTIGLELASLPKLLLTDAFLAHTDPFAYFKKSRPRDSIVPKLGIPLIFMQHGMNQLHLNYTLDGVQKSYYAKKVLAWDELPADLSQITPSPLESRTSVVGFQKVKPAGEFAGDYDLKELFRPWKRSVLLCHNCAWLSTREPNAYMRVQHYLDALVRQNPDTLFVLRSHRGRLSSKHKDLDARLTEQYPNAILSNRHDGPFRFASIHDVLKHVDCVLTHPSTVVLDAVYTQKPVGMLSYISEGLGENSAKVAHLPQIVDAQSAQAFVDGTSWDDSMFNPLLQRYGPDLSDNIDRAADAVEAYLQNLPLRPSTFQLRPRPPERFRQT